MAEQHVCPQCGAAMSFRLGVWECPSCGIEVKQAAPQREHRAAPLLTPRPRLTDTMPDLPAEIPAAPDSSGRATELLGLYGEKRKPKGRDFEAYGFLLVERMLFFILQALLVAAAVIGVISGAIPENSWFWKFPTHGLVFWLIWGGAIYLVALGYIIFRENIGAKWGCAAWLALMTVHGLACYLQLAIGIHYEFLESLNHHLYHFEMTQDLAYIVITVTSLWFVTILWRDIRRITASQ
jgi:hypothetical protein